MQHSLLFSCLGEVPLLSDFTVQERCNCNQLTGFIVIGRISFDFVIV